MVNPCVTSSRLLFHEQSSIFVYKNKSKKNWKSDSRSIKLAQAFQAKVIEDCLLLRNPSQQYWLNVFARSTKLTQAASPPRQSEIACCPATKVFKKFLIPGFSNNLRQSFQFVKFQLICSFSIYKNIDAIATAGNTSPTRGTKMLGKS